MKVKDILKRLEKYEPDDDICVIAGFAFNATLFRQIEHEEIDGLIPDILDNEGKGILSDITIHEPINTEKFSPCEFPEIKDKDIEEGLDVAFSGRWEKPHEQ